MKPLQDLMLEGRIVAIEPVAHAGRGQRWLVRLAVDRVCEGEFPGRLFEFVVHSPTKSGLSLGQEIQLNAKHCKTGYSVDPLQWLPRQ